MPNRPPRREPRVLAVGGRRDRLTFAVVDPWEVRAVGSAAVVGGAVLLALSRLVARERPTILYARNRRLRQLLRRLAATWRIPLVGREPAFVGPKYATTLYPELPLFAPTKSSARLTAIAASVALAPDNPPRRYEPRRRHAVS